MMSLLTQSRGRAGAPASTIAALALALALAPPPALAGMGDAKFKVGDRAPEFTLADMTGREVSLADYAGQEVVLLAFWAMRCGTCLSEIPYLEALHRKYDDKGLELLAVDTDGVDAEILGATLKDLGVSPTYTILLDPEFTVSDTYTNFIVPLTLVIDREGVIRYIHTGFEEGVEAEYEKAILEALGS